MPFRADDPAVANTAFAAAPAASVHFDGCATALSREGFRVFACGMFDAFCPGDRDRAAL